VKRKMKVGIVDRVEVEDLIAIHNQIERENEGRIVMIVMKVRIVEIDQSVMKVKNQLNQRRN